MFMQSVLRLFKYFTVKYLVKLKMTTSLEASGHFA